MRCIILKSHSIHICRFLLEDIPETSYPSTTLIQRLTTVFRSLKTEKMPTVNELVTHIIMAYLEAKTLFTPMVYNREKIPCLAFSTLSIPTKDISSLQTDMMNKTKEANHKSLRNFCLEFESMQTEKECSITQ